MNHSPEASAESNLTTLRGDEHNLSLTIGRPPNVRPADWCRSACGCNRQLPQFPCQALAPWSLSLQFARRSARNAASRTPTTAFLPKFGNWLAELFVIGANSATGKSKKFLRTCQRTETRSAIGTVCENIARNMSVRPTNPARQES